MELQRALHDIGLTSSEIKIYLYLLEHGLASPPQTAKGTGIMRTNTYNILRSLMEKGLVLEQRTGTRKAYLTNDPEALLLSLERKKNIIIDILPDLKGLHATQKNKPKIRFFDGLQQLQELYRLALDTKELYTLGSTKRLYELMPDFFENWLREEKQRGIIHHDIISYSSGSDVLSKTKDVLKGLYEAKTLPAKYGELPTDLLLWNDNLALVTLEEPYFGTILTNPSLARTLKIVLSILHTNLS